MRLKSLLMWKSAMICFEVAIGCLNYCLVIFHNAITVHQLVKLDFKVSRIYFQWQRFFREYSVKLMEKEVGNVRVIWCHRLPYTFVVAFGNVRVLSFLTSKPTSSDQNFISLPLSWWNPFPYMFLYFKCIMFCIFFPATLELCAVFEAASFRLQVYLFFLLRLFLLLIKAKLDEGANKMELLSVL